eukprot:TCALIF_04548-PB protein Name:"Protein of unknown function" AED:0.06 eAED:0.06 QI:15/0.87/0.88/0.88/0.62/0.55/9/3916/28
MLLFKGKKDPKDAYGRGLAAKRIQRGVK